MANLLAEGYRRLFKGKRFYIVGIVLIGLTILLTFMYLMINKMMSSQDVEEFKMTADSLLMAMNGDMPLFIGITAGMLIVQDFRNNTIRNKVTKTWRSRSSPGSAATVRTRVSIRI